MRGEPLVLELTTDDVLAGGVERPCPHCRSTLTVRTPDAQELAADLIQTPGAAPQVLGPTETRLWEVLAWVTSIGGWIGAANLAVLALEPFYAQPEHVVVMYLWRLDKKLRPLGQRVERMRTVARRHPQAYRLAFEGGN